MDKTPRRHTHGGGGAKASTVDGATNNHLANTESYVVDKYGRLCYVNHEAKQSTWLPSPDLWKCQFGLPYGWELAFDKVKKFYFISHVNALTTFFCPDVDGNDADSLFSAFEEKKRMVTIRKNLQEGFGFVAGSERPVLVRSVIPDGASDGRLFANDQIISINGQYVYNLPQPDVIGMIKLCDDTLAMEVIATEDVLDARNQGQLKSAMMSRTTRERRKSFPVSVRFIEDPVVVDIAADRDSDAIKQMLPNVLKIVLENGQTKSFQYGEETTVKDIFDALVEKMRFECDDYLSLVLVGPFVNQKTYLREEDKVAQVFNKKQFARWECRLQVCFVMKDIQGLYDRHPLVFNYLYEQTCHSVVHGQLGAELKYDMALRLAALQVHEQVSRMSNTDEFRMTVKEVENAYGGLESFLPKSVLFSTKKKDLRRSLAYYMKQCQKLASPGQRYINGIQAKVHYLMAACETSQFGGKAFNAILMSSEGKAESVQERKSEPVTIFINTRQGIAKSVTSIGNEVVQIADIVDVSGLVVTSHLLGKHHLKIFINSNKPLSLLLEPCDASDVVFLLSGYAKINAKDSGKDASVIPFYDLTQSAANLPDTTWVDDDEVTPPSFKGVHRVIPSTWSYSTRCDEIIAGDARNPSLNDIGIPMDTRRRPPPYDEAKKRLEARQKIARYNDVETDRMMDNMQKRKHKDDGDDLRRPMSDTTLGETVRSPPSTITHNLYKTPRRNTAPPVDLQRPIGDADFSNASLKLRSYKEINQQAPSSFMPLATDDTMQTDRHDDSTEDLLARHDDATVVNFANSAFSSDTPVPMYGEEDEESFPTTSADQSVVMPTKESETTARRGSSFKELIAKHPLSLQRSTDSESWVQFDDSGQQLTHARSNVQSSSQSQDEDTKNDPDGSLDSFCAEVWPAVPAEPTASSKSASPWEGAPIESTEQQREETSTIDPVTTGNKAGIPRILLGASGKRPSDPFVGVDPFADRKPLPHVDLDEASFNNSGIEARQWNGSFSDLSNTFHDQTASDRSQTAVEYTQSGTTDVTLSPSHASSSHNEVNREAGLFRVTSRISGSPKEPTANHNNGNTAKEIVDENLNLVSNDHVLHSKPYDWFDRFDEQEHSNKDRSLSPSNFVIPPPPSQPGNEDRFSPTAWICPPPPPVDTPNGYAAQQSSQTAMHNGLHKASGSGERGGSPQGHPSPQDGSNDVTAPVRPSRKSDAFRKKVHDKDMSFSGLKDIDRVIESEKIICLSDMPVQVKPRHQTGQDEKRVVICKFADLADVTHSYKPEMQDLHSKQQQQHGITPRSPSKQAMRSASDRRVHVIASFKDLPTKQRSNSLIVSQVESIKAEMKRASRGSVDKKKGPLTHEHGSCDHDDRESPRLTNGPDFHANHFSQSQTIDEVDVNESRCISEDLTVQSAVVQSMFTSPPPPHRYDAATTDQAAASHGNNGLASDDRTSDSFAPVPRASWVNDENDRLSGGHDSVTPDILPLTPLAVRTDGDDWGSMGSLPFPPTAEELAAEAHSSSSSRISSASASSLPPLPADSEDRHDYDPFTTTDLVSFSRDRPSTINVNREATSGESRASRASTSSNEQPATCAAFDDPSPVQRVSMSRREYADEDTIAIESADFNVDSAPPSEKDVIGTSHRTASVPSSRDPDSIEGHAAPERDGVNEAATPSAGDVNDRTSRVHDTRRSWFLGNVETSDDQGPGDKRPHLSFDRPIFFGQSTTWNADVSGQRSTSDVVSNGVAKDTFDRDRTPSLASEEEQTPVAMVKTVRRHQPTSFTTSTNVPVVHRASLVISPTPAEEEGVQEFSRVSADQETISSSGPVSTKRTIHITSRHVPLHERTQQMADPPEMHIDQISQSHATTTTPVSTVKSSTVKVTLTSRQWNRPIPRDSLASTSSTQHVNVSQPATTSTDHVITSPSARSRDSPARRPATTKHSRTTHRRSKSDASGERRYVNDYAASLRQKSTAFYSRRGEHYAIVRTGSDDDDQSPQSLTMGGRRTEFKSHPADLNKTTTPLTQDTRRKSKSVMLEGEPDRGSRLYQSASFVENSFRYRLSENEEQDCLVICRTNRSVAKNFQRQLTRYLEGRSSQADGLLIPRENDQRSLVRNVRTQTRFLAADLKVFSPPIAYLKLKPALKSSINCVEKLVINIIAVYRLKLPSDEDEARQLLAVTRDVVNEYRTVIGVMQVAICQSMDDASTTNLLERNNDLASALHSLLRSLREHT